MKHKLTKKTISQAQTLDEDYTKLYTHLLEIVKDEDYTKSEINYFLRKEMLKMKESQDKSISMDTYCSHNMKKCAIEINKKFKEWHADYEERMRICDRITYTGFFSMVAYSITLVCITAFQKGAITNWLWLLLPAVLTLALLIVKIRNAWKLALPKMHVFGDIIIFLIVTGICYASTIYFIIFLWIYEVLYMLYLQMHIVEEDL